VISQAGGGADKMMPRIRRVGGLRCRAARMSTQPAGALGVAMVVEKTVLVK